MNIGKNIKELRGRAGLTQKDLAEKLNVTPQAVSRWELDTVEPSIDTLKDMASLFDVTMDQLMSDNLDLSNLDKKEEMPNQVNIVIGDELLNGDGDDSQNGKEVNTEEVKKPEVDELPIVGKCKFCGKIIHAGEGKQIVKRGGESYYECDECVASFEKSKAEAENSKFLKIRKRAWIFSPIIGVIVMALVISGGIIGGGEAYIGASIGFGILLGVLSFTTAFDIIMRNNFVGELWLEVATWGCVKLPGIIFTLDFDGIVFLILTKILFFILSGILVVGALILATTLALVCSIFVFPVSVYWAYKRPEKTDLF